MRPLLNERQREKVSILDEYSTLEGLKEFIDEENIPKGERRRLEKEVVDDKRPQGHMFFLLC